MSSNGKDGSSPSGEKRSPEKQPTPSRRYEKRQKMVPLELTLGSSSAAGDGSGPYVGIPHKKRCCVCESSADTPTKRKRTKKTGLSMAPPSPAVKPEPQKSTCDVCKAVFTTKEELMKHGGTKHDVGKLFEFHMIHVKKERDNTNEQSLEALPLLCGSLTGLALADPPQLARDFIPDLNFPPPPEYYY